MEDYSSLSKMSVWVAPQGPIGEGFGERAFA